MDLQLDYISLHNNSCNCFCGFSCIVATKVHNTEYGVRQTEYVSIIDSLRYATDCTSLDIAYVVGLLCKFTSRLSNEHWHALEIVMRYLKRTVTLGLHYQRYFGT
ncbi:Ty1/Copia polyprotein/retrotransposon, putative [Medicago truncatula]|uniref:Ty1/Copia polyprotein/retrotransposon, putative n=1 Tax=Medicago truncatula TaxID=3880 RepID=A0A072UJW6_MEDTR|nr:Ty1/Copia polyprotein/retrotransposon, putative [Medicago truncatula]